MARRVFFSYAREDHDWVAYVAGSIGAAGFLPSFDQDIIGGQQWWDRLLEQIEECDVFVPVLSQAYLRSVPCRIEVSYALELGKTLIPLDLSAGALANSLFIEPIKFAQWIPYDRNESTVTVLKMVGALNNAENAPPIPEGTQRPAAPGTDVMSTAVRLVSSPPGLTETEQWAVVGELRAHMRGENSATAQALLGTFLARHDLLAQVYQDAQAMLPPAPPNPPQPGPPQPAARQRPPQQPRPANPPRQPEARPQPRPQPKPRPVGGPNNYHAWSIIVLVAGALLGLLVGGAFGLVALNYSNKVDRLWDAGDGHGAEHASLRALTWAILGGIFVLLALVFWISALASAGHSTSA